MSRGWRLAIGMAIGLGSHSLELTGVPGSQAFRSPTGFLVVKGSPAVKTFVRILPCVVQGNTAVLSKAFLAQLRLCKRSSSDPGAVLGSVHSAAVCTAGHT